MHVFVPAGPSAIYIFCVGLRVVCELQSEHENIGCRDMQRTFLFLLQFITSARRPNETWSGWLQGSVSDADFVRNKALIFRFEVFSRIMLYQPLILRNTRRITQGNVEYVAVRAGKDECATPAKLVQNYVVCRLDKKLDVLLGFIKTHLKSKTIVFFTSCAQVCVPVHSQPLQPCEEIFESLSARRVILVSGCQCAACVPMTIAQGPETWLFYAPPPLIPNPIFSQANPHTFSGLCVGSQVRFAFELLCALQPGMPVMALHGKCKHARRTQIYLDFVRRPGAVLLATDIAARGLDFPSVDWVIQVSLLEAAQCRKTCPMCFANGALVPRRLKTEVDGICTRVECSRCREEASARVFVRSVRLEEIELKQKARRNTRSLVRSPLAPTS